MRGKEVQGLRKGWRGGETQVEKQTIDTNMNGESKHRGARGSFRGGVTVIVSIFVMTRIRIACYLLLHRGDRMRV